MTTPPPSRPIQGILWMLVTGLCFVAVTALVKLLEGRVPAPQAAFLRYALGLVFLIPMLRPIWAARLELSWKDWVWFTLRGAVHTLGVMLWFYAMSRITLAEVTAMNYLSPVYVTIGAALILGERLAFRRLAAVGVALLGALIILRPGFQTLDPGHIAMLFTAVLLGGSYLLAKHLSGKANAAVIVGMLSIVVTIGLAPFAAAVWVPPSMGDLALLFGVAIFATAGHYTMTLAFAAAPVAVTQPVTFLQLVWAVLLGWIAFDEAIDGWVVLGGCVILSAVSYITWREAVLKRRALAAVVTPVHVATKV